MKKRKRYLFTGIVQGVGFRPFIHRTAKEYSLGGYVKNRSDGVIVEVEGAAEEIEKFLNHVLNNLPPIADLSGFSEEETDVLNDSIFSIVESEKGERGEIHIAPDIAVCEQCLIELLDKHDRRYEYPFINCTNCGPRMTIIKEVPYDRPNTSMECFPLCLKCRNEYEDPGNRRFHAEPNACPACGPFLTLLDQDGKELASSDCVEETKKLILQGNILAIKGIGGFHLSVDATNNEAVARLRNRKFREKKPLAIMVKNIEDALKIADFGEAEKKLLLSPQRPIVLLKKRKQELISPLVAPGMCNWGIMLPYAPLHHLLFRSGLVFLIMTSANQTDEPICISNREAILRLKGIADYFLVHNRDILIRCDDSIAMSAAGEIIITRRSRGLVPKPIVLKQTYPNVLALGPQIKTTICILKDNFAFLSPHIGDLETPQARDFLHESVAVMKKITECEPQLIACDIHPGYYSSLVARKMKKEDIITVQHHHAHIVSCMAENQLSGKVIGIAMDGTGYGTDGQVWGGEFLLANEANFVRAGHIKYYPLPSGEKAIREPWRVAASLLKEAFGDGWKDLAQKLDLVPKDEYYDMIDRIMAQKINTPLTSSLGRLFDGVAAILGVRRQVSFEGQAAMELEGIAKGEIVGNLPYEIIDNGNELLLDFSPAIKKLVMLILKKTPVEHLAICFHRTLAVAFTVMADKIRKKNGLNSVVLSGGCFQNRILLEGCISELKNAGFDVFFHRLIPTNDGGISLGQAVCAGAIAMRKVEFKMKFSNSF